MGHRLALRATPRARRFSFVLNVHVCVIHSRCAVSLPSVPVFFSRDCQVFEYIEKFHRKWLPVIRHLGCRASFQGLTPQLEDSREGHASPLTLV